MARLGAGLLSFRTRHRHASASIPLFSGAPQPFESLFEGLRSCDKALSQFALRRGAPLLCREAKPAQMRFFIGLQPELSSRRLAQEKESSSLATFRRGREQLDGALRIPQDTL